MNTFTQNIPENFYFRGDARENQVAQKTITAQTKELKLAKIEKPITIPAIMLIAGFFSLLIYIPLAFTIILPALAWLFTISPDYAVILATHRGEEIIFKSKDKEEVVAFSQKVNKSLKKNTPKKKFKAEQRVPFLNV